MAQAALESGTLDPDRVNDMQDFSMPPETRSIDHDSDEEDMVDNPVSGAENETIHQNL